MAKRKSRITIMNTLQPGTQFGRLTYRRNFEVLKSYGIVVMGEFECSCENKTHIARFYPVVSGRVSSCGCLRDDTFRSHVATYNETRMAHPEKGTELYKKWESMKGRCANLRQPNYGGRGITVCVEWNESYDSFRSWAMANGWRSDSKLSLERTDVNGNYCPENCELIPISRQSANQRTNKKLTAFGETKNVADWARDSRCVVSKHTLYKRIEYGFSDDDAIRLPLRQIGCHEAFGEFKKIEDWILDPRLVVESGLFKNRMYKGWNAEAAMTKPRKGTKKTAEV